MMECLINLNLTDTESQMVAKSWFMDSIDFFREIDFVPSAPQFAAAFMALEQLVDKPLQIWTAGAGTGKSRIIATLIFLVKQTLEKRLEAITIIFSSHATKQQDQKVYQRLQSLLRIPIKCHSVSE